MTEQLFDSESDNRMQAIRGADKVVIIARSGSNFVLYKYVVDALRDRGIDAKLINTDNYTQRSRYSPSPLNIYSIGDKVIHEDTYVIAFITREMIEAACRCAQQRKLDYAQALVSVFGKDNVTVVRDFGIRPDRQIISDCLTTRGIRKNFVHLDAESESNPSKEDLVSTIQCSADGYREMIEDMKAKGVRFERYESAHEWVKILLDVFTDRTVEEVVAESGYLRLYVPANRYQAEQIESFVRLFENYLNKVEQCPVEVDSLKSLEGTLFVFRMSEGHEGNHPRDLGAAISKFDAFMSLCNDDPMEACRYIAARGIPTGQSSILIAKYAKQYKRLQLDSQQEFESRIQMLRHALQSESLELQMGGHCLDSELIPPKAVGNMVLPTIGIGAINDSALGEPTPPAESIKRQIFGQSTVYSSEEHDLLRAIRNESGDEMESMSLKADLDQLKDTSANRALRLNAWQRLQAFGKRNSRSVMEVVTKIVFEHYLGKLEGGP